MLDLKYKNLHKFDIEMDFKMQVKKNQFSNGAWLGFKELYYVFRNVNFKIIRERSGGASTSLKIL